MAFANDHAAASGPMAEINITPLVDVMLVLLIIFMITAPIVVKQIPFPLQPGDAPDSVKPQLLGLSITSGGGIYLDGERVSRVDLDQRLRIAAAYGALRLEIRPQAESSYDDLANVLAIAHNNDIRNLAVEAPRRE